MKYPLPSYAASIWLAGDTIWLGLPSSTGSDLWHSVPVPATIEGLAQVLRILKARERDHATTGRVGKIGTDASPTRAQVEAALARREHFRREREAKVAREPKPPKPPKGGLSLETLKELGLL